MKYLFLGLILITGFSVAAKRNTYSLGILTGVTGARVATGYAASTYIEKDQPALSFTADFNLDRSRSNLYLSIPVRLHTLQLLTHESYPSQYSYWQSQAQFKAASLGAGIGLNYLPVRTKTLALCAGIGVVPAIEVGTIREQSRFNITGEIHTGLLMFDKVYMGVRYTYYALPYASDYYMPLNRNSYYISNVQFDLRFKLKR